MSATRIHMGQKLQIKTSAMNQIFQITYSANLELLEIKSITEFFHLLQHPVRQLSQLTSLHLTILLWITVNKIIHVVQHVFRTNQSLLMRKLVVQRQIGRNIFNINQQGNLRLVEKGQVQKSSIL